MDGQSGQGLQQGLQLRSEQRARHGKMKVSCCANTTADARWQHSSASMSCNSYSGANMSQAAWHNGVNDVYRPADLHRIDFTGNCPKSDIACTPQTLHV